MATVTAQLTKTASVVFTYSFVETNDGDNYRIKITNAKLTSTRTSGLSTNFKLDYTIASNKSGYEYSGKYVGGPISLAKGTKSKSWTTSLYIDFYKQTSAKSVTISFYADLYSNDSGAEYEKTVTVTFTLPALISYKLTFNANGGTGAPAVQTMYGHGVDGVVSSPDPTRVNHKFLGWSRTISGQAEYQANDLVKMNNTNVTLYAIWQQVYESPSLTINRSYRCDSSGNPDDEGTYAAIAFTWATFSANATRTFEATVNGVTVGNSAMQISSGTGLAIINANLQQNESYSVLLKLTDNGCTVAGVQGSSPTTTRTDSISQSYKTIAFRHGGHGCGIGVPASEEDYLRIGLQIRQLNSSGTTILHATNDGNLTIAGQLSQSSDKRLKKHISNLSEDACDFIASLKPVLYEKDGSVEAGFYAQDVNDSDKWGTNMVGELDGYLFLRYTEIIAPLVAYCQNLEQRIAELERNA